jgi:hypothetical protein
MKPESQITNTQYRRSRHIGNHSSLIDIEAQRKSRPLGNQSKKRSTPVENVRQITPFYAKQTQFWKRQNGHKHLRNNEIRKNGQLVIQTKQSQFKANKAKNKPNSKPI